MGCVWCCFADTWGGSGSYRKVSTRRPRDSDEEEEDHGSVVVNSDEETKDRTGNPEWMQTAYRFKEEQPFLAGGGAPKKRRGKLTESMFAQNK